MQPKLAIWLLRDVHIVSFLPNIPKQQHIFFGGKFQHRKIEVDLGIPSFVIHDSGNSAIVSFCILIAAVYQVFVVFLILWIDNFRDFIHHVTVSLKKTALNGLFKNSSTIFHVFLWLFIVSLKYGIVHTNASCNLVIVFHSNSISKSLHQRSASSR